MLIEQFQYYVIPISACICFMAFIFAGKTTPLRRISNYFLIEAIMLLAIILAEVLEKVFAPPYYQTVNWQRWFFSIIAYILRPGIAYILLLIPLRGKRKTPLTIFLLTLPLIVNTIFLLISPLCGIVFKFTDGNHYSGGPLKYLPTAVGIIYLIGFLIFNLPKARIMNGMQLTVSLPVVIMCCLSIYLESEFDVLGSLPTAGVVGMIFYYVYFYIDQYTRDALTGAYQRGKFYHDIKGNEVRYFILFDINGLKQINDNFGHISGDKTLESFGQSVLSVLPQKADFYRIGGDEFVILYHTKEEKEIQDLLDKIKNHINPESLPFGYSYGYSYFYKAENFNSSYRVADQMLYENKEQFWKNYHKQHDNTGKAQVRKQIY